MTGDPDDAAAPDRRDATPPPGPAPDASVDRNHWIERVVLGGENTGRLSPLLARDVQQAMVDLAHQNSFEPASLDGPFVLHLSVAHGRLVLDIRDRADAPLRVIGLALGPFRRLLKDYLMLVDSHALAVEEGREQRMEAIDMGRRGLHNEGATLMRERLTGKVEIDFETARRLFTLVCVLHQRL